MSPETQKFHAERLTRDLVVALAPAIAPSVIKRCTTAWDNIVKDLDTNGSEEDKTQTLSSAFQRFGPNAQAEAVTELTILIASRIVAANFPDIQPDRTDKTPQSEPDPITLSLSGIRSPDEENASETQNTACASIK